MKGLVFAPLGAAMPFAKMVLLSFAPHQRDT